MAVVMGREVAPMVVVSMVLLRGVLGGVLAGALRLWVWVQRVGLPGPAKRRSSDAPKWAGVPLGRGG
jgi:hypothetical protein